MAEDRFWKIKDALDFIEDEVYYINMQRVASLRRSDDKSHRYWKEKLGKAKNLQELLKELLKESKK